MFLASLGAIVMLVPLMLTRIRGKPAWKDPIRMGVLGTWILAYIATPIEGFIIEFNEASWHGTPLDRAYGSQQYFALFGITLVAAGFLAVDFFQDRAGTRKSIAWFGSAIATFGVMAGLAFTYFDPGNLAADGSLAMTTTGWVYTAALGLVSVVILAAAVAVSRGYPEPVAIPVTPAIPMPVPIPAVSATPQAGEGG
jgi:hypothetical protein